MSVNGTASERRPNDTRTIQHHARLSRPGSIQPLHIRSLSLERPNFLSQVTLQTRIKLEEIQPRIRLSLVPIPTPDVQSAQRSRIDANSECPAAASAADPPRHAQLGVLLGSVMRQQGIGPCADDNSPLSSKDIPLPPDTVEDIEVEVAEVQVPYALADGISLSNQFADLSRTEEEDDPMDATLSTIARKRPPPASSHPGEEMAVTTESTRSPLGSQDRPHKRHCQRAQRPQQ